MNWLIYKDGTGEILSIFSGPEEEVSNYLHEGLSATEGYGHFTTHFIDNGYVVERQPIPYSLDGLVLSGLPQDTQITIGEHSYTVTDGIAELVFEYPGTYVVRLTCFPYIPNDVEVIYED